MFRSSHVRLCAAVPPTPLSPSRSRRWVRRLGWTTAILGGTYLLADVASDNSLTRSLRTVANFVQVAAMYKFTDPTTPEEYHVLNKRAAEKILYVCLKNEGLYIKLGQGLNAMSHILPREYTDTLRVLLDRAPPVPMPLIEKSILHATGAAALSDIFVKFEEEPIASASIAQVHRAWVRNDTLPREGVAATGRHAGAGQRDTSDDGLTMVAVKVRKPSVERQAVWDVRTYQLIAYLMQRWFQFPTDWVRHTVVDALYREMDFTIEQENATTMRRLFQERSHLPIYAPYIYPQWTSPSLLVMEWVEGTKLVDVEAVRREYANPSAVIKTVFDAFGDMIFRDGFVHCDPHGANVLVRPRGCTSSFPSAAQPSSPPRKVKDYEVVFLDFGMCAPLTEKFRMEYALFLKAIFTRDVKLLQDVASAWGIGDSEMFASMQMQKPMTSMKQGEYGEVTREEVVRMQRAAHAKVQSFLTKEENLPKELPMVVRGLDILRGINRLYGSPVSRLNMLMQGAMRCLGPLHDYVGLERYLDRLNARRQANNATRGDGGSVRAPDTFRSVYDADATRVREEQAAAVRELAAEQPWYSRIADFVGSLYRLATFRFVLFQVQLWHLITYWWNTALGTIGAAPRLRISSFEDRADKMAQSV